MSEGLKIIPLEFYGQETVYVARLLIGAIILRKIGDISYLARIVETEAYTEDDPASHSHRGPTDRCRVMFGPGGYAYIYRSYGVHNCLNFVTEPEGSGCAVLVRAVEPLSGRREIWDRRFPDRPFDERRVKEISNGPGKLCGAYDITRNGFNGHRLDNPPLQVAFPIESPSCVVITADVRIGITRGTERLWRFFDANSPFLSRGPTTLCR